jgi:hypothetical protein
MTTTTCECSYCGGPLNIEHAEGESRNEQITCPHCGEQTKVEIGANLVAEAELIDEESLAQSIVPSSHAPPAVNHQTFQGERLLCAEGNVIVTVTRFLGPGATYSLANLSSVQVATTPPSYGGPGMLCFLGILALVFVLGFDPVAVKILMVLIALSLFAGAIFWGTKLKPLHRVVLTAGGSDSIAFTSTDYGMIHRVVGAVNQAIVLRGQRF